MASVKPKRITGVALRRVKYLQQTGSNGEPKTQRCCGLELGPQADLQENCRRGHADAEKALSNPHEAALAADVLESLIAVHGDLSILAFRSAFRIGKPDQCNATHALVISRKWLPKPETVRVQFVLKGILVASYEYLAKEFDFLGLAAYLADGKGRKFPEPEVDIFGGIVLVVEGERASLMRGERSPLSSRSYNVKFIEDK